MSTVRCAFGSDYSKKSSPKKNQSRGMDRNLGILVAALLLVASTCESAIFNPVSESHRSAASELLSSADGSFGSLEETYEALKTFEVLGIEKKPDIRTSACVSAVKILSSTSSALKDLFHALRVNGVLKCELNDQAFPGIGSKLKDSLNGASSLLDFYYSIGGLILIKIIFDEPEHKNKYATGGRTRVPIHVTGVIKIDSAEIAILENDLGSVETQKKLDLPGESAVALSANHLQKLRLSFRLTTPSGQVFKPHQAFLKLKHDSGVEHIFVVANSGKKFEIILDFLGLVDKFFYLSGTYDLQLTVGDSVMENSFLQPLGHIELDLPEAPEKAARPPPQPVDMYSRYGPKAEISHIFRVPEKRPPRELSLAFFGLVILPFFGFLAGLFHLRANLKNFPKSIHATFAILFHLGIAAVLSLYALFWFKLDLFTTLKTLGLLGIFLMFVGHKTLSHLASTSAKLKTT
ncbi:hypothetical protein ABFS82_04G042400 [Erythranthe guttata]